jgi:hypothetical protein
MADVADPEDLKLLVRVLRELRQWDQSPLAAAVGVPMSYVEGALLPALAAGRVAAAPFSAEELADPGSESADLNQALAAAVRSRVATFLEALDAARPRPWERAGPLSPEDRSLAAGLWERLESRTAAERLYLVECCREFRSWPSWSSMVVGHAMGRPCRPEGEAANIPGIRKPGGFFPCRAMGPAK